MYGIPGINQSGFYRRLPEGGDLQVETSVDWQHSWDDEVSKGTGVRMSRMRVKDSWSGGSQWEMRKGKTGKASGVRAREQEKHLGLWSS